MKYRFTLIIAALLAAGCGSIVPVTTDKGPSTTSGFAAVQESGGSGNIMSSSGYQPSNADVQKYGNDLQSFLKAMVPNFDNYRDAALYVNGKVVYVKASDLLHTDIPTDYLATLKKGTKVYQQADSEAKCGKLKKNLAVKVCAISGDWALVQTTGGKGIYGFVKVSKLTGIHRK